MGTKFRRARRTRVAAAGALLALASAGSAAAFQALPPGGQVNSDPLAGIDNTKSVSGQEPTNADVVGGALTAGKVAVPWAVFRQTTTGHDQVFSRSFANGAWTTRGIGTVGGQSDSVRPFSGSLNFDQGQDGEAPAIDFAGTGRTVPWATWYEHTTAFSGKEQIFASRFDNTGDANQGKWLFSGQSRGTGSGTVNVPSLNIHTNQDAENPSIAGGSAANPAAPGPWVTWQETGANAPGVGKNQIFVSKPLAPGQANCDGVTPAGVPVSGHVPAVGAFCFQQVGVERLGTDPSLNIDRTRDGVEPDIAFTGANDAVPWVIWYEQNNSTAGLGNNEMVFAAKGVAPSVTTPPTGTVDGGFNFIAVGNHASGVLDTTNTCGANLAAEQACALNFDPTKDAEDPRVAAGTMNPANPTVPWAAWDESVNGVHQIFVSRLVGGTNFVIANGNQPISSGGGDATRPDITFSGNTPYVSWRQQVNGVTEGFYGHFVNPANPTFVLDASNVPLTPTGTNPGQADVREPISSSCTANPFNADGAACQGGAVGTPFFLLTNGTSPLGLFADAYQPGAPVTGSATAGSTSTATLNGSVNPEGASVNVAFQYGTSTSYGSQTAAQKTGTDGVIPFSAALAGLPAGTTIHYRAIATSDFGTLTGADQTLTTPSSIGGVSSGHAKVSGNTASVRVSCTGASGASCKLHLTLTVTETLRGHKLIAVSARHKRQKTHKVKVTIGTASVTLGAGQSQIVKISLNRAGKNLLARHHSLKSKLTISETLANGHSKTVGAQTLTFHQRRRHK